MASSAPEQPLQLGLVAQDANQQQLLQQLVLNAGLKVAVMVLAAEPNQQQLSMNVDAWLVDIDLTRYERLELWLGQLQCPVVISDGWEYEPNSQEHQLWCKRMLRKLQQLVGQINLAEGQQAARHVWVLGASTGGPESIRQFFSALPSGLDVGFIYVQHIDGGYEQSLAEIIDKCSDYKAFPVVHGDVIHVGRTAIIANDQGVEVLENGTLAVTSDTWRGPYSPSIDQVFANVAQSYGERCGVIVFSGMGDDGRAGARLVVQKGGQVWAQAPSSCAVSSMPDEVIAEGMAQVIDAPERLAARLASYCQQLSS